MLPAMLQARRRLPKFACPRWAEAGRELLSVLDTEVIGFGERIATQLSEVEFASPLRQTLQVEEARQLMADLHKDFKGTLDSMQFSGVAVWSPAEPAVLGRWLTGYTQHATETHQPRRVHLLVPLDTFPGCSSVE